MMYRQAQPQVRAIRVHSAVSIKIGWLQVHRRSLTTSTSRSVGSTIDIRPFFDDRTYFEHAGHDRTRESTGLLGMRHLKEARDLVSAAREAEQRCNRLIDERVLGRTRIGVDHTESHMNDFGERHNHAQPTSLIKHMDTLSDMICTVVDLAECMRTVHPQRAWVTAANDAYAVLGDFINRLNTDPALYHALLGDEVRRRQSRSGSGSGNTQQMRSVTQEEHTVARLFLADFERAGVHLEATRRQQLVGLQNRINEVGHAFATGAGARNGAPGRNKRESVAQLEEMLRLRYNVATLLGKESYAELYLLDKMARTPGM